MSESTTTMNTRITTRLNSATAALKQEFVNAYSQPDEQGNTASQEEIQSAEQTAEFVEALILKHLAPTLQQMEAAAAAMPAATVGGVIPAGATPTGKKKSAWSIFLSDEAKHIAGWDSAPNKASFASEHYKRLYPTKEAKDKLVADYYAKQGGIVPGTAAMIPGITAAAAGAASGKKKRISGLDAFKIDWYARRKESNPDAKGIDSQCTEDWKALSQSEKDNWKEIRRQQVMNLA